MIRAVAFLIVLSLNTVSAQKLVKKSFVNSETNFIQIATKNCFKVETTTALSNEIIVEAIIDGEYTKDLLIAIEQEGATMMVSADFQPGFVHPNDKLSAHKVLSISLKIQVPQYKKVKLYGTASTVIASGKYQDLQVILSDGKCVLNAVSERAVVTTQSGDIILRSKAGTIEASSKYGLVKNEGIPIGDWLYTLTSTTGNISIKKTE